MNQAAAALQHAVATVQARHPDLRVAETGDASITQAINNSLNLSKAEGTSVPVTLILLLIVFGALVAAGIPVLLALTAVTASLGVLTIVSHWLPVNDSTFEVVVIAGMAVGVDYSLFYLRREREERARGRSSPEALRVAARASGRTIGVSGLTVMAAMSGLFLVGGGPFSAMAVGTIAVVGIAVAGSLTVLPALLAWLGPKADAGRIPFLGRRRTAARPSRLWAALARRVVARPVIWGRCRDGRAARAGRPGAGPAARRADRRRAEGRRRDPHDGRHRAGVPAGPGAGRGRGDRHGRHRAEGARGRGRAARPRGGQRGDPRAGHRHRDRRRASARGQRAVGRQRGRLGVHQRAADAAEPDPARHAGQGARRQLRGGRGYRGAVRQRSRAALQPARRVRLRRGACLRAAPGGVPVGHRAAGVHRAEPAVRWARPTAWSR